MPNRNMVPPALAIVLTLCGAARSAAQAPAAPGRTWEIGGVPALSYDADEGFGYGAIVEYYDYGAVGLRPYRLTLQPRLEFSTRGRRDITLFFGAPHLLSAGWRLDAFVGSQKHLATPYHGIGNDTDYDAALDDADGPNPYYYRFGRTRAQALVNVQRRVRNLPLPVLAGAGVTRVTIEPVPYDSGTTLLAEELRAAGPGAVPGGWTNFVRAGLIRDTRDREVGPTRGAWSELLVLRSDSRLGSQRSFTRWTLTDNRYIPVGSGRLVYANRFMLQDVSGGPAFYELFVVQTSFKQHEGLGGAKTLRGIPKNRFVGRGLFLWNAELRWRAAEFRLADRQFRLLLNGFVDSGRVWVDGVRPGELFRGLHNGFGGGVRLGMGESFIVAMDAGHSSHAGLPIYIGLGYLF